MNRKSRKMPLFGPETLALLMTFLIGGWGLLTIVSSQSHASEPFLLAGKQLMFLILGLAVMWGASKVPFRFYCRNAWILMLAAFGLLLLLPLFGVRVNGMCGWFRLGGFHFQPTEPAKGIYLLTLVIAFSKLRSDNLRFWGGALLTLVWLLPILLQPDFGTAAIYLAVFASLYFLSGGSWRNLLLLAAGGVGTAALFVWRHPYAWRRITGLFNPDLDPLGSGWHIRQFELAIARGGWFGAKLGGAVWSNAYLPLAYNDSAYATMAETLGWCGVLPVWICFTVLIASLLLLAFRFGLAREARLYLLGAAALVGIQTLVHISVNLCLLPTTGLTLPLISYGGSSLFGCCLLLGIALSAANETE